MARDPHEQIVEDAINSSLERAMNTAPSPGFLARVRERAAMDRGRAAARRRLGADGFAASVSVVLALAAIATMDGRGPVLGEVPVGAAAVAPQPSPLAPARSVSPAPARGRRPDPSIRPRAAPAMGHGRPMGEPGQMEALARLARGLGRAPAPAFVVGALNTTSPLPELRSADLPRLERKPLVLKAPEWEGLTWQGGGTTSDRNEGSDW